MTYLTAPGENIRACPLCGNPYLERAGREQPTCGNPNCIRKARSRGLPFANTPREALEVKPAAKKRTRGKKDKKRS